MNNKPIFDWGIINNNPKMHYVFNKENFEDDAYQKFFEVEKDDVVVDIGASCGPFTYHILNKKPKIVYCLEPHKTLYKTLTKNVFQDNVVCLNKAISNKNGKQKLSTLFNEHSNVEDPNNLQEIDGITFKTFTEKYNIKKIDFLKLDCEGFEYDIFNNEENEKWILKNVKKIAGEWHLGTTERKQKFKKFLFFLEKVQHFEVLSWDYVDIKWSVYDDWFLDHYRMINVYIKVQ